MSAFLVDNGHIDVLVNAFAAHDLLDGRDPKRIGQILWTENNRSVNYRYSERRRHPHYVLHTTEAPLHPVAVLKAIHCFSYQSCERPDWDKAAAYLFVEALRRAILEENPELAEPVPARWDRSCTEPAYLQHPVYAASPWEFESAEQAAKTNY